MANDETYDETIGRLRDEYQLDLSKVFNQDDLENEFDKLKDDTGGRKGKKNLLDNVGDFFKDKPDGHDVQNQVTENFSKQINEADSADDLIKGAKVGTNIRDVQVLQDTVDLKANVFIESSTTGDQIIRRAKAREVVSDKSAFDDLVEEKTVDLIFENVTEEIKDIDLVRDLPPSKLANVLPGSGFRLTTLSAEQIKAKVLA